LNINNSTGRRVDFSVSTMLVIVVALAALYFGRDVLLPFALAMLLSFVLAPLTVFLKRLRIGRVVSVLLVVIFGFMVIFAIGGLIASQVTQLAENLPQYQLNMSHKIKSLRGITSAGGGTLEKAANVLEDLNKELKAPAAADQSGQPGGVVSPPSPVPVEIRQPDPGPLTTLGRIISPLVDPLTTTGLVVIFVVFILLQKEDLRNRLIRLLGARDIRRATAAIDEAAQRLSRYFLLQVAVNGAVGIVVATGLAVIGIPSAILWGILVAILRFVPYIGPFIAAALPLAISAAVDSGWSLTLWTAALLLSVELLAGQVVEPMLYGRSTGITPVAIVVSAAMWTGLWGPVGLLVATPLTLCLVVLGRHVEQLQFLEILLGDTPPLTPPQIFYQRMLARDPEEAAEQAELILAETNLATYYGDVALAGLNLAQIDLERGDLDSAKALEIRDSIAELMDDLADVGGSDASVVAPDAAEPPTGAGDESAGQTFAPRNTVAAPSDGRAVLCVGGRTPLDQASALLLADLLRRAGFETRIAEGQSVSAEAVRAFPTDDVGLVWICYLNAKSVAYMRYAVRRVRRRLPKATILLACWTTDTVTANQLREAAGADGSASSMDGALALSLNRAEIPGASSKGNSELDQARASTPARAESKQYEAEPAAALLPQPE
jgi:predicted PurR-regulated permease PerM